MPISTIANLSTLVDAGLASIRVRLPGYATDIKSYLGAQARATAMAIFSLQRTAEAIDRESPPNLKSSDLGIRTWADISGVPANTGGYGANSATKAKGGAGFISGTTGAVVLAGQQLVAPDGTTLVTLVSDVTVPAVGSFAAITPGIIGNLAAGTLLTWVSPPTGVRPTVALSQALTDGTDNETIPHLFGRLSDRWQAPPKGGADIDYEGWAESADGVDRAYVYPLRGGSGTVHVVITAPGTGLDRVPSASVTDAVLAKLLALRPTEVDEVLALQPVTTPARGLTIRASAFLHSGYTWDWNDTTGSYSVASYSAAGPITLTLATPPPADLVTSAAGGNRPLIQVVNTSPSSSVIPQQVQVLSIAGNVLTLATALDVAPTVGDEVHAGSYVAPLAAAAIIHFVDSLGPSRVSGFADAILPWDDVVSVWGAGTAAVEVLDNDGSRMISRLAGVNGLTIQVGAGTAAAVDFEPGDNYTTPPELAYCLRVVVTRASGS